MKLLTTKENLEITLGIWAVPKYETVPGEFPFTYDVTASTSHHWRSSAILVHSADVFVQVPAGVDLYPKAHETLDLQEKEALRVYMERVKEINEQRAGLLQLTHQAENVVDVQ